MPDIANEMNADEGLLLEIRSALPDEVFFGSITAVDGLQGDELDEGQALHSALYGRSGLRFPNFLLSNIQMALRS
jgi:hypothetical protein